MMSIVAKGVLLAISVEVSTIWPMWALKLRDRRSIDDPPDAAPDDGAHAHGAGFAGTVERRPFEFLRATLGEKATDGDHLAMRGRIMGPLSEIESARENGAVARDDGAEGKIGLRGKRDCFAHQPLVFGFGGSRERGGFGRRIRGAECRRRKAGHDGPPVRHRAHRSTCVNLPKTRGFPQQHKFERLSFVFERQSSARFSSIAEAVRAWPAQPLQTPPKIAGNLPVFS